MNIHKLMRELLKYTIKNRVVTTSELAFHFKVSWNTAEKYMVELIIEGKVVKLKKAGVNLWLPK